MHVSLWKHLIPPFKNFPALGQTIEADIVIIGGGITGITAAYELSTQHKNIILLDKSFLGSGTTGDSTGNLYVAVQTYYHQLIKKFNLKIAQAVAQARSFAIDYIENIVQTEKISCSFARRPWYLYTKDKVSFFNKEVAAFEKLNLPIALTSDLGIPFSHKRAAILNNQARFNPLSYIQGLSLILEKKGVKLFENTAVLDIKENTTCEIITTQGKIRAKKVLIATHTPLGINTSHMYTAAYRSYVVGAHLSEQMIPDGNFWDLDSPHHTLSSHPDQTGKLSIMLLAGSHHKTGQTNALSHLNALKEYFTKFYNVNHFTYTWSAQHYRASDLLPYIGFAGKHTKNLYMATGYFADGLVYGTLAGKLVAEYILDKNNDTHNIFHAQRSNPLRSLPLLIKENMNVFWQYLRDYTLPKSKNLVTVKPDEGKVLSIGGKKCAVYRDKNGHLHTLSAICPHLKGIVSWNNSEKTWDCPCHGSRFNIDGKVLEGPAMHALAKLE